MKAQIFYFASIASEYEGLVGYKHLEEIRAWEVWSVAQEIFGKGLNVMITHTSHNGEEKIMLYIDDKNFKQR